jgi:pyridoxal/pyridoxine/pyridoxamine kinase
MREQQAEHDRHMAAERAELQRQQDELAAAKAEQERIAREAREAAEAAARLDADHAEALIENAFIDSLHQAAEEAARVQAEKDAAEVERVRRERVQFVLNGPGDMEIALTLASHYQVAVGDAMQWLKKFDYEVTDEQFAAMNATGNLPHLDQAA